MSGLVDKWTSELAKLREKGQTIFGNGSSAVSVDEPSNVVQAKGGSSTGLTQAFNRVIQVKSPVVLCSEASVSMLVDCFSA